jgi:hypothetical protein
MENRTHMGEIHQNFTSWMNNLAFYKDEIATWQNRLDEVASQNNNSEILKQVEHFQNQFIRQREVMDILNHDIRLADAALAKNAAENPVASDHRLFEVPTGINDQIVTFEKIYGELKSDFEKFLSPIL